MDNYIWYASYGSNISTNRFLCYIKGGQAIGATTSEEGCRDNTLPIKYENILINRKQYFSKNSKRWQNKGVAFLDNGTSKEVTYGRMYLVTKMQFEDIVKQENVIKVSEKLDCKLEEARKFGSAVVVPGSWYGRILFLGEFDKYPIFTFTNVDEMSDENIVSPSEKYIQMIGRGLIENYNFDLNTLTEYFLEKKGIKSHYSIEKLREMLLFLY